MPKTLAFLHTSPVHVATFDRLLAEIDPTIPAQHFVDESLLQEARTSGINAAVAGRVHATLAGMMEEDAAVVLCTCSTIGGCAEQMISPTGQGVLRVDRAMAEQAVALGSRIVVAAALESTLAPTRHLLAEVAAQQGRELAVETLLCAGAWRYFEEGDQDGYLRAIATTLHETPLLADVIVLAQASMAGAAAYCTDLPMPILSSPRLGVEAAVRAYHAAVG